MRKRISTAILAIVLLMLLPRSADAVAPAEKEMERALAFGAGGSFKIMIIADIQDGANVSKYTMELIEKSLDAESPDLVVLLGDNVYGMVPSMKKEANVKKSIDTFMAPIVERNIPFCVVFGNHDGESAMSNAAQLEYYKTFPGCLAEAGHVTGVGNYNVVLQGSDGAAAANLVFFDSGSYAEDGEGTYAYVASDQIEWFETVSEELAEANGGGIPAYVFQHIPVYEIYDVLLEAEKGGDGAVRGQVGWKDGYYRLNPEFAEGYLGEGPCPPDLNNGEFQSFVEDGNVTSVFFGHDHTNDFIARYEGIDLIYTPGAGFHSYGNGYKHGVRILTLDESSPEVYETRMVYFEDVSDTKVPAPLLYMGRYIFNIVLFGGCLLLLLAATVIILIVRRKRKKRAKQKG